jgi:hypothetical protein
MRTRRPRPAAAPRSAFAGSRFPADVIVAAVRWYLRYSLSYRDWYLRYSLSYRDVEELLAERGVEVDHVTVHRWVLRFAPLLADAARPCRHAVCDRWQVDGRCCIIQEQGMAKLRSLALAQIAMASSSNATANRRSWLPSGQLVSPPPNVLDQGVAGNEHPGVAVLLPATQRPRP